jgi:phosphomannomutase
VAPDLVVSYSGVRGIVGESLDETVAARFGQAFRAVVERHGQAPRIIVANDTRPSSPALKRALLFGLQREPVEIIDIGSVPAATVQVMMAATRAGGGVVVTASHNPLPWNGFKFLIGPDHIVLDGDQTQELFALYHQADPRWTPEASAAPCPDRRSEALARHHAVVLEAVGRDHIKAAHFHVVVDSAGGAGSAPTVDLLNELGCEVHQIDAARDSEPTPANLSALCQTVREERADIGLAQDLDADRLAIVSERGEAVGEEYTLALAVRHLLDRWRAHHPVVVKNSSTSRMIDDLVAEAGAQLEVARVGEVNLSKAIIAHRREGRVAFGGEGNGGVIYPSVSYGRDSLIGVALVLDYLAYRGAPASELVAELPRYYMRKDKVACEGREHALAALEVLARRFADQQVVRFDGVQVSFGDGSWAQARPSNTEPVVRITVEAKTPERADQIMDQVRRAAAEAVS